MFAALTSKGQITLPKEIRDRLGLDGGSLLDFQVLPDETITARTVVPDARRIRGLLRSPHIRGLLKSPHPGPLTVKQMDEGMAKLVREKHAPSSRRGKPSGQ